MAKASSQPLNPACRHLGTAADPFNRVEAPTEEHRCYLWMQRDRIDLDHQEGYCLSGAHRNCPWLHISLPCHGGIKKFWGDETAQEWGDKLGQAGSRLTAAMAYCSKQCANRLVDLALWLRARLPEAVAWFWKEVCPFARAAAVKAAGASLQLARAALKARPVGRKSVAVPRRAAGPLAQAGATGEHSSAPRPTVAANEDFSILMQLGKDANRAGRRREANLCFSRAASADPASEEAWLWMAATSDDSEIAMACLEKALAINPTSGKARTQLAGLSEPAPAAKREPADAVGVGVGAPLLLQQGISALDAGNEDRAYQYFTSATEADTSNEAAWFWRAKTSVDLVEVINCLDRVLEINPRNEKAKASLSWALDRQQTEVTRQRFVASPPATSPHASGSYVEAEPQSQPLLKFASSAYFLLGLLWIAAGLYPFLDQAMASLYRKLAFLPVIRVPYLSTSLLGLTDLSVPEFNLFYLVPLFVGFLFFVVMETSAGAHRAVPFFIALVTGTNMAAAGLFVESRASFMVLLAGSALAAISALLGRVVQQRRSRGRSGRSRRSVHPASATAALGISRTPRF